MMSENVAIVVDVGGTNIRLAQSRQNELINIEIYPCAEFTNIDTPLREYLQKHQHTNVTLCIAIASPIKGDAIAMTNLDWAFSITQLKQSLNLAELFVINDYYAIATAVPFLKETELQQIGGAKRSNSSSHTSTMNTQNNLPVAVCGPGSGLGVAHLIQIDKRWHVLQGEGGHVDIAANNDKQNAVIDIIRQKYPHVSAERLLCGPGLVEVYRALCIIQQQAAEELYPEQISEKALKQSCPICLASLDLFCSMLGSFAGNLALNLATFGGVYIAGGIVPKVLDFFIESDFRFHFENKGRYQSYNAKIPTFVITAPYPGLRGAAIYIEDNSKAQGY